MPGSSIIDLNSRRRNAPADSSEPLHCRECGSEWFRLDGRAAGLDNAEGAVTLAGDGRVTGYCGVPKCMECGALAQ